LRPREPQTEQQASAIELAAAEVQIAREKPTGAHTSAERAPSTALDGDHVHEIDHSMQQVASLSQFLAQHEPTSPSHTQSQSMQQVAPLSQFFAQHESSSPSHTQVNPSPEPERRVIDLPHDFNEGPLVQKQLSEEVLAVRQLLRPSQASSRAPPVPVHREVVSECGLRCKHCSGQLLLFMVAPVDQFVCDLCNSVMSGCAQLGSSEFASDLMSCRDCDFDVCRVCYAATPNSESRLVGAISISPEATAASPVVSPGAGIITTIKQQLEADGKAKAHLLILDDMLDESDLVETEIHTEAPHQFVRSTSSSPN